MSQIDSSIVQDAERSNSDLARITAPESAGRTGCRQEELSVGRKNWLYAGRTGCRQEELAVGRKNWL
jgi:hypothetical protein